MKQFLLAGVLIVAAGPSPLAHDFGKGTIPEAPTWLILILGFAGFAGFAALRHQSAALKA
jgi:hypothetical protein